VIEQEARGASPQLGERGELALRHQPLGKAHLETIQTDREHAPTRHRHHRHHRLRPQFSAAASRAKLGARGRRR
jgi:hypothetical protein